jgi:hypothetical protein
MVRLKITNPGQYLIPEVVDGQPSLELVVRLEIRCSLLATKVKTTISSELVLQRHRVG